MFPPEHMRAARAAMLQAAIAAFFMDCVDDGADELTIVVTMDAERVNIDCIEAGRGGPIAGFNL